MFASVERLERERARHAVLALELARNVLKLSADDRREVLNCMRFHAHQRDVLEHQISWYQRDAGWSYPSSPAWTD